MISELSTVTDEASVRNNNVGTKVGVGGSGKVKGNESPTIIPTRIDTRAPAWLALGFYKSLFKICLNRLSIALSRRWLRKGPQLFYTA